MNLCDVDAKAANLPGNKRRGPPSKPAPALTKQVPTPVKAPPIKNGEKKDDKDQTEPADKEGDKKDKKGRNDEKDDNKGQTEPAAQKQNQGDKKSKKAHQEKPAVPAVNAPYVRPGTRSRQHPAAAGEEDTEAPESKKPKTDSGTVRTADC